MKKIITLLIAVMAVACVNAQTKGSKSSFTEAGTLYVYGLSYSASDSVVYITDLLMLNNAQMTKRTNFLVNRHELSAQLTKYMSSQGMQHYTSCIVFRKNLNKIDKDYQNTVEKLKKRGFLIKNIDQTKFRFETVREDEE
ncbi:MAG: hypothetical protein KBT34_05740 [Prevotella sp.]|nr:hypothetical protein [Candidatus Prevotella equi]